MDIFLDRRLTTIKNIKIFVASRSHTIDSTFGLAHIVLLIKVDLKTQK